MNKIILNKIPDMGDADLVQMNRIMRHRLRNLYAGMKMTLDAMSDTVCDSHPHMRPAFDQMGVEMESLFTFTKRMDLIFSDIPQPEKNMLHDLLMNVTNTFNKKFPFCNLELDGSEDNMEIEKGSLIEIILTELLANAGEAAGNDGEVKLVWSIEPELEFGIVNTCSGWPEDNPADSPKPFYTNRSRHDGMGLTIVNRLCEALGYKLHIVTDVEDMVIVKLTCTE